VQPADRWLGLSGGMPEDRAVLENEIARLRSENAALKKDILSRGLPLPSRRRAGAADRA
jgi:hypothetical protein